MVAEDGRDQAGQLAVVLVVVGAVTGEHEVGLAGPPELLEPFLRPVPVHRQPPVGHVQDRDGEVGAGAERRQRGPLLVLPRRPGAGEDQRPHPEPGAGTAQRQDGAAGADRDVVAVGTEQDELVEPLRDQRPHQDCRCCVTRLSSGGRSGSRFSHSIQGRVPAR